MARRLRLLTHGLKTARRAPRASLSWLIAWGDGALCALHSTLREALRTPHSSLRIAVRQRVLEEDVSVVNPMISSVMRCVHGVGEPTKPASSESLRL